MPSEASELRRAIVEREEQRKRAEKAEKKLAQVTAENAAGQAMTEAGIDPRVQKVLMVHLLPRIGVSDIEETPRTHAVDAKGNYAGPVSQVLSELQTDPEFAPLFRTADPKGKAGGGSGGGGAPPHAANPFKRGASFNATQQAKLLKSNPSLAARLKAEAEAADRAARLSGR